MGNRAAARSHWLLLGTVLLLAVRTARTEPSIFAGRANGIGSLTTKTQSRVVDCSVVGQSSRLGWVDLAHIVRTELASDMATALGKLFDSAIAAPTTAPKKPLTPKAPVGPKCRRGWRDLRGSGQTGVVRKEL